MTRVLPLACIAVVLAAASAHAGPKPSIAVLGIEVADTNGIAQADTQVARELTEGLRSRAKAGSGPYQLAPGSDKELIDEKLIKNCDNEAPACMAAIGNDVGAEMLMYGKISKEGKAYRVDLKLLNVTKKQMEKTWSEQIPIAQANGQGLQGWAKTGYAKLTGESSSGQLVIVAKNVDRGTVLLDGEEKGSLVAGRVQINGLPEGKYKLRVEAQGFQTWEADISITAGQSTSMAAEPVALSRNTPPPPPHCPGAPDCDDIHHELGGTVSDKPGSGWKYAFIGGAVASVGIGSYYIYTYTKLSPAGGGPFSFGANCANESTALDPPKNHGTTGPQCQTAHDYAWKGTAASIGTGVAVGFTVFSLVKWVTAKPGDNTPNEHASNGHRKHKNEMVVTPIIAPGTAGATVQIDF